jgi:diaminopimelate epimerase
MSGVDQVNHPEIVEVMEQLVRDFVIQVVPVQQALVHNKLESYRSAISQLQMCGNKARCQAKIDRNEAYLEALTGIETMLADIKEQATRAQETNPGCETSIIYMDGKGLMTKEMEKMQGLVEKLNQSGFIGMKSDLLGNGKED